MRLSAGPPARWHRTSAYRGARSLAFAVAAVSAAAWSLVLFLGLSSPASAGPLAQSVRVLIYDQPEPVEVAQIDPASGRVLQSSKVRIDAQGRLLVDGRWISGGWSPARVAASAARSNSLSTSPDPSASTRVSPFLRVGERRYRGEIRVRAVAGRIEILNRVGLEEYVASILGSEMSPSWPADALRAQAVASRTYALYHAQRRQSERWDVEATVASQVYRGVSAESPETWAATRTTAGQILTFADAPILAVFHSTAGGQTATAGEVWGEDHPYLRSMEVEEDDAPHTYWRISFETNDFEAILSAAGLSVGAVRELSVSSRTESGRAGALRIKGARGVENLQGDVLRSFLGALGLRSKLFEVRALENGFAFVGSGYGHGVGMSQWGARVMAERGDPYQRILAQFYPGARLERRPEAFLAARERLGSGAEPMKSGPQAQGDRP